MVVAVIRPAGWNLPLFLHVAGAMATLASLVVALYAVKIARERGDQPAAQFAFRVLLRATLPAYVVMRVFAQVIQNKEFPHHQPGWVGIGFGVSDGGLVLLIAGLILTGLMARRASGGESVAGATALRVAMGLAGIMTAAYVVAIWAMTTKPGS